jgi:hypothetical protein
VPALTADEWVGPHAVFRPGTDNVHNAVGISAALVASLEKLHVLWAEVGTCDHLALAFLIALGHYASIAEK